MTNFPNGVASFGVPVLPDVANTIATGRVYWVSNNSTTPSSDVKVGQDAAHPARGTFNRPFATIDYAIGQCRAGQGDIILVKPGHAESISSATIIVADVAGVRIIGLGSGDHRPTLTFTTTANATIAVSANDVSFENFLIKANVDSVVAAFSLTTAKRFKLVNCEFADASVTDVSFVDLVDINTTDNAADGLTLDGVKWVSEDNACVTMVDVDATIDSLTIKNCYVSQTTITSVGILATVAADKQLTNLVVENNKIDMAATDSTGGLLITGTLASSYGVIARNYIQALDAAAADFLAAQTTPVMLADNWYTGAAGEPRAINTVGGTIYNDA